MNGEVILGLHGFSADSERQMHDAGVCILVDGVVVAAVDEERLSRAKRDGRFPLQACRTALEVAGIAPDRVDAVAFVDRRSPWQTVQVWRYALEAFLRTGVQPWRYLAFWSKQMLEYRRVPPSDITTRDWSFFDHHRSHAGSAYYTSPYGQATVVTLDGMGDFSIGGAVYRADAGQLSLLSRSNGYFSPGHFYMIVTEYLGFTPGRHEGKITGLAAHGDPDRAYGAMEKVIRYRPGKLDFIAGPVAEEFFNVIRSRPGTRTRQWYSQEQWSEAQRTPPEDAYVPKEDSGLQYFRRIWAGYSREDIAAAAQKRFEDVIAAYVTDAVQRVGIPNLALAGGCFANVRLNQRLLELPEVDRVYIQPNMGDGGLSAGAALLLHNERRRKRGRPYVHVPWRHVYLGPEYTKDEVTVVLAEQGMEHGEPENLADAIARALVDGRVVALFQGRMEYGPRALGNRSLLAAAVDPSTPDRLNGRLGRTEFMPFAPVILEDEAQRWFPRWAPTCAASHFMTITYDIEPELGKQVPAVVHADGTARPQVVGRAGNPLLHAILERYNELTDIPVLINTSFNMHEEPIVCSPADALNAFKRGAADILVIEGCWVEADADYTNAVAAGGSEQPDEAQRFASD